MKINTYYLSAVIVIKSNLGHLINEYKQKLKIWGTNILNFWWNTKNWNCLYLLLSNKSWKLFQLPSKEHNEKKLLDMWQRKLEIGNFKEDLQT